MEGINPIGPTQTGHKRAPSPDPNLAKNQGRKYLDNPTHNRPNYPKLKFWKLPFFPVFFLDNFRTNLRQKSKKYFEKFDQFLLQF